MATRAAGVARGMTQPVTHRVTSMPAGVTRGAVSPATGSIRLAGEHFAAATLYLLAGSVGLVWIAPELAAGDYLSPHVAGVTHLFTLGWLTMTIFGALYQLLPVALGAPIRWPKLGHASFWTFAPGAGLFACGIADDSTMLHHAGVGLVGIGVILAGAGDRAAAQHPHRVHSLGAGACAGDASSRRDSRMGADHDRRCRTSAAADVSSGSRREHGVDEARARAACLWPSRPRIRH